MMKNETAEQLKKQGFWQDCLSIKNLDSFIWAGKEISLEDYLKDEEKNFHPSLSELIKTCGDKFTSLKKIGENEWVASSENLNGIYKDSPEEAVANLWLTIKSNPI